MLRVWSRLGEDRFFFPVDSPRDAAILIKALWTGGESVFGLERRNGRIWEEWKDVDYDSILELVHLLGDGVDNRKIQYSTRKEMRKSVVEYLGGKCVRCGFDDYRSLQIDHINGGGSKEHKEMGGSYQVLKGIVDKINSGVPVKDTYQLLCANCNWIKRAENGEVGNYKNVDTESTIVTNRR